MAKTVISAKYPPLIDPTRATLAFGRKALPILKRDLESKTLLIRQRAIMALSDYLHDPEHIAEALRQEFIDILLNTMHDNDVVLRQKSAECFYLLANHAIGRQAMIDNDVIQAMSFMLDDTESIVRLNTYKAIEMLSEMAFAAEAILEAKLVETMIGKVKQESNEIMKLIMDTLHFCFKNNVQQGLDAGGMSVFRDCLNSSDEEIRWRGARNIADLWLIEMLSEQSVNIRISATNALMKIAITTKGKYTVLEANAIPHLIDLLNDLNSEIRVYSLKALTCLAEAPEGRRILQDHVPQIRKQHIDTLPIVSRAATVALNKILWKP